MPGNYTGTTKAAGDILYATDKNIDRKDVILNAGDIATSAGTANAQTLALDAQITSYTTFMKIRFKAGITNTDAMTMNVNTIGAKNVKKINKIGAIVPVVQGDIRQNCIYEGIYDGTDIIILNISSIQCGDGSDGVFHATVNTTLNPSYKIFQYKDFTVDSGKTLDFGSNFQGKPIIILVNGNLNLAGATVTVNAMGALSVASGSNPSDGVQSNSQFSKTNGLGGLQGFYNSTASLATGGAPGAASGVPVGTDFFNYPQLYRMVFIGSAGGSGGKGVKVGQVPTNTGGQGGKGGGGILFVVAGNVNVTGAILTANAENGANGNQTDTTASGSGAGGGGQGGSFTIAYYGSLTGSPTTFTASKGVKGTCSHIANTGQNAGGGGGGSGAGSGVPGVAGETANLGIGGGNGSDGVDGYTNLVQLLPEFNF